MINGITLKNAFLSATNNMSNHRTIVDELNVFPVPDGDTGTNMSMTMANAAKELNNLEDTADCEAVAEVAAAALLRGARGNSGVILSLLFRGFSNGLKGIPNVNGAVLASALQMGVDAAYKAAG